MCDRTLLIKFFRYKTPASHVTLHNLTIHALIFDLMYTLLKILPRVLV